MKNNEQTYWVPAFVKEKRFHNWLVDARDWAVSRSRYWGTPIPIWTSEDGEEVVCIGSIQELMDLSGVKDITDIHRESIDHITIPSKQGKGVLRRIDEVFDCWFESGSMPYAQKHYPFENVEKFNESFPADFIAEGLDQTRGWFYTLMVLSTCLFDKPAFKNLIVNGLVLAGDGKKMSKRLKNYPDPMLVVNSYGADALRLYLINSPVVRAEPLKFQEAGVLDVLKNVFLPWFNAFRFFIQNVRRVEMDSGNKFVPDLKTRSTNTLDCWIQASLQTLIKFTRKEMGAYHLYTVVPVLIDFLNQLTNWYVRLNRNRLRGTSGPEECQLALSSLYEVLLGMTQLMAPFTPFFTEYLYRELRTIHPNFNDESLPVDVVGKSSSVHFTMLPEYDEAKADEVQEARMKHLQSVIELGRVIRERRTISLKVPVKEITVVAKQGVLDGLEGLRGYVLDELNTANLSFSTDEKKWSTFHAEANNKTLGKKLGQKFKPLKAEVAKLTHEQCVAFQESGSIEILGETLGPEDLFVKQEFKGDKEIFEAGVNGDSSIMVIIDVREDAGLVQQGVVREVMNRVQKLRKKAGLAVEDVVTVYFTETGNTIVDAHILISVVELKTCLHCQVARRRLKLSRRTPRP